MNTEIFQILNNAKVASFGCVETLTEVKIPKKWGLNGVVTKRVVKKVQFAYNYESAVNRHRKVEGENTDFKALPLQWGEWLVPNRVIVHKGKYYARMYEVHNGKIAEKYYINGTEATSAELSVINAFLQSKNNSSRQGVSAGNEVRPTAVCFDNIVYLSNGTTYGKRTLF